MKSKIATHTPGPWKARQWGGSISIDANECAGIAFVNPMGVHGAIPTPGDSANARLIAAAPELLEALKIARGIIFDLLGEDSWDKPPAVKLIEAVISKAEAK